MGKLYHRSVVRQTKEKRILSLHNFRKHPTIFTKRFYCLDLMKITIPSNCTHFYKILLLHDLPTSKIQWSLNNSNACSDIVDTFFSNPMYNNKLLQLDMHKQIFRLHKTWGKYMSSKKYTSIFIIGCHPSINMIYTFNITLLYNISKLLIQQ